MGKDGKDGLGREVKEGRNTPFFKQISATGKFSGVSHNHAIILCLVCGVFDVFDSRSVFIDYQKTVGVTLLLRTLTKLYSKACIIICQFSVSSKFIICLKPLFTCCRRVNNAHVWKIERETRRGYNSKRISNLLVAWKCYLQVTEQTEALRHGTFQTVCST